MVPYKLLYYFAFRVEGLSANVARLPVPSPPSHSGLRRLYGLSTNPYPVHRLDKVRISKSPFTSSIRRHRVSAFFCSGVSQGTTGVLVLARTKALARELSQQFRARAIDKSYLALVHGDARSFPAKEGVIDALLSFDDGRVRLQAASTTSGGNGSGAQAPPIAEPGPGPGGGKATRTAWEVLDSSVSR